jgi:hypothetical protein
MAVFSYANLRHMDSQEKRDAILTSAAWKQWTILGGMFTSIVVAPMVKTVGFGAAAWV